MLFVVQEDGNAGKGEEEDLAAGGSNRDVMGSSAVEAAELDAVAGDTEMREAEAAEVLLETCLRRVCFSFPICKRALVTALVAF